MEFLLRAKDIIIQGRIMDSVIGLILEKIQAEKKSPLTLRDFKALINVEQKK